MKRRQYHEHSVLIVEDDAMLRETIVYSVREFVKNVYEAASGPEALTWLEENDVDAILSDIKMPGMDGITMIETLSKDNRESVALIMTGHDEKEYARRALAAGVHDFIDKPFAMESLTARLVNAIETSQLRRSQGELVVLLLNEFGRTPTNAFATLTMDQKVTCIKQLISILKMRQARSAS